MKKVLRKMALLLIVTLLAAVANAATSAANVARAATLDICVIYVTDRTALKAVNPTVDKVAVLRESGREGLFDFVATNMTAWVTSDPQQGIYIAPNNDPTGASGCWVRRYNGRTLARWFGSTQTAIEAAHNVIPAPTGTGTVTEIEIDRSFTITSTATWPNGKVYYFTDEGELTVSTGVTLTIRGVVDAPVWRDTVPNKIFNCTGTGKVIGLRFNRPEWWGAKPGDSTFDSSPALNAASASVDASAASDGDRQTIKLANGYYYLGSTWEVRPTHAVNLVVEGDGVIRTRLVARGTFAGTKLFSAEGNSDPTQCISDYVIRAFGIDCTAKPILVGFSIGSDVADRKLIGVQKSKVEDIFVVNAAQGFHISHVRLVDFIGCSSWNDQLTTYNTCVAITQNGGFTGDLDFKSCQFVNNSAVSNSNLINILSNTGPYTGDTNYIAGIRFDNGCIFYAAGVRVRIVAGNGSGISDIWFNPGCQFDGSSYKDFYIYTLDSTSKIRCIFMRGCFIAGSNLGSGDNQIEISANTAGTIRDIVITDNWFNGARGKILNVDRVIGLTFDDNTITETSNPSGPAVQFTTCTKFSAKNNKMNAQTADTCQFFATVLGASDYYDITGNQTKPQVTGVIVNDAGTGTNKVVSPNM